MSGGDTVEAVSRRINGRLTVDELVSDVALAVTVAKAHGDCCGVSPLDYAKRRIRYTLAMPAHLVMADALIDHWMGA